MARTAITPQTLTLAGAAVTLEAANVAGNSVPPNIDFLWVKNGGVSSITVTIPTPGTVNGLDITDRTVTVASGAERLVPIRVAGRVAPEYAQADGTVNIDYSAVTSVTVAAVKVP